MDKYHSKQALASPYGTDISYTIAIHYYWTLHSLCYPAILYQSGTIFIPATLLQLPTTSFQPVTAGLYDSVNCQAGYLVQYEKFH